MFAEIETPALILDEARLNANTARMRARCEALGVTLRPHLKTAKSLDVAVAALAGVKGPITVSTLHEAEHFARAGYGDILYAVAVAPHKIGHVHRIQRQTGARILLCVDSVEMAQAVVDGAESEGSRLSCLIEVDCGEHRSGVAPAGEDLAAIADVFAGTDLLLGVMTHAGHSYGTADLAEVARIAKEERRAAADSAALLRSRGFACPIVSVGSTPTVLHARHLEGVSEVRAGIYMFWDLAQLSRGMCRQEDIAVSVLATVIGHNRAAGSLVIDAGALALSKDTGANTFMPTAGFGLLCDVATMEPLEGLRVDVVHQEHGTVRVADPAWFARLPIGARVRVLPNHACLTCAAYDHYELLSGGRWPRINGW